MRKLLTYAVLIALASICFILSSHAQGHTTILFIMDASGSMGEQVNGLTKLEHAKLFVKDILNANIPADYGLTVFGSEETGGGEVYFSPVPAARNSEDAILKELELLYPAGKSPIASAILDGTSYFDPYDNNIVVLITDGIENTGGSPVRITSMLKNRGVINHLYVVGFIENASMNPLLAQLVQAGNGSYHNAASAEDLIREIQSLTMVSEEKQSKGLIGYRCFISEVNGFPAYGSMVNLMDESGQILDKRTFWRGVFEGLEPGRYTLTATNSDTIQYGSVDVTAGEMTEYNFVFNVETGGFTFRHLIKGTSDGKAYGTITKVYHETGETVYTGTSWSGDVMNLPEGVYKVEGYVEGQPAQTQDVMINNGTQPEVEFSFEMGKGRISYRCFLDSTRSKVANGTIVRILRLPYNELALERNQWRGTSPFLPLGEYNVEGYYKGIGRQEIIDVRPDSTSEIDFVFNIRQVRFSYRCFRNETQAPATGVDVKIFNERGFLVESNNKWRGTFVLPEGIYTLQALFQGKTIKRTLNLFTSTSATSEEDVYFTR